MDTSSSRIQGGGNYGGAISTGKAGSANANYGGATATGMSNSGGGF